MYGICPSFEIEPAIPKDLQEYARTWCDQLVRFIKFPSQFPLLEFEPGIAFRFRIVSRSLFNSEEKLSFSTGVSIVHIQIFNFICPCSIKIKIENRRFGSLNKFSCVNALNRIPQPNRKNYIENSVKSQNSRKFCFVKFSQRPNCGNDFKNRMKQ